MEQSSVAEVHRAGYLDDPPGSSGDHAARRKRGEQIKHVKFNHMFVRTLAPWHHIPEGGKRYETFPA